MPSADPADQQAARAFESSLRDAVNQLKRPPVELKWFAALPKRVRRSGQLIEAALVEAKVLLNHIRADWTRARRTEQEPEERLVKARAQPRDLECLRAPDPAAWNGLGRRKKRCRVFEGVGRAYNTRQRIAARPQAALDRPVDLQAVESPGFDVPQPPPLHLGFGNSFPMDAIMDGHLQLNRARRRPRLHHDLGPQIIQTEPGMGGTTPSTRSRYDGHEGSQIIRVDSPRSTASLPAPQIIQIGQPFGEFPPGSAQYPPSGQPILGQPGVQYPIQPSVPYPIQPGAPYPAQPSVQYPGQPGVSYPGQPGAPYPGQPGQPYPPGQWQQPPIIIQPPTIIAAPGQSVISGPPDQPQIIRIGSSESSRSPAPRTPLHRVAFHRCHHRR
ncbi:hypothetical protein RhiJN_07293 [Ceratobasidium sp. AG-Ba]|nr:hypothetical protein RhiJN_07293 [Ceratobasidium sp. AG-Ba]